MLNEPVDAAGANASALVKQNNAWTAKANAAADADLADLGWQLFGQCVQVTAPLAEKADKQADSIRLWQRYGKSVQQFNESLGK